MEEMLTAAEVARRAGVHRSTVGDWVAGGLLPVAQTIGRGKGAQRLFALSAAQPLIDEAKNKVGSTSEAIGGAAS